MDSVDLMAPGAEKRFKYGTRVAQRLAADYAVAFNPGISKVTVEKDYDLFFSFCQNPKDLLQVQSIRKLWISEIHKYRYYLDILKKFDIVVMNLSSSVSAVNEVIGGKAFFMPLGIDAVLFCPYPNPPERMVDMYSIGRRSEKTHEKLMKMAENNDIFYVYDSIIGDTVFDALEHRKLFANMTKRSKYFMVNPGKIDVPDETTVQSEIGNRFFEGCAAGAIMVGEHPKTEVFNEIFNWPDAVVNLPFDSENVDLIFDEFKNDPEREKKVREKNVLESLRKHDWLYRWEVILQKAGMEPAPGYFERQKMLNELCELVGK
jgi:uncharacterized protein YutD